MPRGTQRGSAATLVGCSGGDDGSGPSGPAPFPLGATRHSHGEPSPLEQEALELLQRARRDPAAEGELMVDEPSAQQAFVQYAIDKQALIVDWGVETLGHRKNALDLAGYGYRDIGIGIVDATHADVGPLIVVHDFGVPAKKLNPDWSPSDPARAGITVGAHGRACAELCEWRVRTSSVDSARPSWVGRAGSVRSSERVGWPIFDASVHFR